MACLDSLQPEAKSIVREAHAGWLPTDQVHQLMADSSALGVPMTERQPIRPKGAWWPAAAVCCGRWGLLSNTDTSSSAPQP